MEKIIEHGVPAWQREVEMYMRNFARYNDPEDIQLCLNYLTDNVLKKTYVAGYANGSFDGFEDIKDLVKDKTGEAPGFDRIISGIGAERSYMKWEGIP